MPLSCSLYCYYTIATTTIKEHKRQTTAGDNPAQPYKIRRQQFYDARSFSIFHFLGSSKKLLELVDDISLVVMVRAGPELKAFLKKSSLDEPLIFTL